MNHVYEIATGRLISSTSLPVTAAQLKVGYTAKWLKDGLEKGIWNTATLTFDPHPVVTNVNSRGFLLRFTRAERLLIYSAAKTDEEVEDFLNLVQINTDIRIGADSFVTEGLDRLIALGHLTTTRKEEILNG